MKIKNSGKGWIIALAALTAWGCDGMLSSDNHGALDSSDAGVLTDPGRDAGTIEDDPDQRASHGDSGQDDPDSSPAGSDAGGGEEMGQGQTEQKLIRPNQIDQARFFTCSDTSDQSPSPSRLKRVNQLNWVRNAGRARLGSPAEENPLRHSVESPYSSYAAEDTVEASMLSAYMDIVSEAAKPVISEDYYERANQRFDASWLYQKREALGTACMYDGSSRPDRACVERFATVLLERGVFQRPAEAEEVTDLADFASGELALERSGERKDTLSRIVSGAWLMTGALFQSELGGEPDASGRRQLGPWEIAHAVGNALMARRPGTLPTRSTKHGEVQPFDGPEQGYMHDLYLAAEDGSIQDKDTLAGLLRAHLTGVQLDEEGGVTHVGGEDPERFDIRREALTTYSRRGEYGLPEGVREFFVEYFDYAEVTTDLKSDSAKTSKYEQISGIHDPMYGAIVQSRGIALERGSF